MLQEAVLVKKDIVKIILTAVLMLLLVNCFDRPEKSKKSSSYKNEESEVLTDNNYYREQEVTEPMLFDYANLNYQSSTTIISGLSQVVRKIIQLPHVQKQLSL